jgi:TatD DNase family protein
MLIDTHCHIQFDPLFSNVDNVIDRAVKEGVEKMIVVGCDIESSKKAIKLSDKYEQIFASVGLHPQDSKNLTDKMWREFTELARHKKVVAIGETGLDYFKQYSSKGIQQDVLKKHIKLAKSLNKPLIIHNRSANEDCLQILQNERVERAVFHCFGSELTFARKVWKAGYMTSFTGIITYPKANNLREIVEECPLDVIMIETDSPFLAPQKFRGKTNEPSYVLEIALEISRIKNLSFKQLAEITTKNAENFFNI